MSRRLAALNHRAWVTVEPHHRMTSDELDELPVGSVLSVLVEGLARLTFMKSSEGGKWCALTTGGVPTALLVRWPSARRERKDPA